jgi:hypothetical protein
MFCLCDADTSTIGCVAAGHPWIFFGIGPACANQDAGRIIGPIRFMPAQVIINPLTRACLAEYGTHPACEDENHHHHHDHGNSCRYYYVKCHISFFAIEHVFTSFMG